MNKTYLGCKEYRAGKLLKGGLLFGVALTSGILGSNIALADGDSAVDQIEITVPAACSMSGTVDSTHTTSMMANTYSGANGIGKTTLKTTCNDNNGFSIYTIGYTGDVDGGNTLVGASSGETINTAVYSSGATDSSWSMKVTKVTDDTVSYNPENMTITNSFDSYHTVPSDYAKVAEYKSTTGAATTDTTKGARIETTYDTFVSRTQTADTYTGQVKYVMVHPYDASAPEKQWSPRPQPSTAGCITYYNNTPEGESEGTMGKRCDVSDGNSVFLSPSNFSRTGYGFAGWSDRYDYTTNSDAHFYGPLESITAPEGTTAKGLSLYAVWVESVGNLQDADKVATLCGTGAGALTQAPIDGTANLSSVTALTDQRDNQTYAIAKLADGNCWMIENLRLENTNSDNSTGALAQGYGTSTTYGNFSGLANPEISGFSSVYSANSLYSNNGSNRTVNIGTSNYPALRMPRYNHMNTHQRASGATSSQNVYSYGNYYTWHAAIADTTYHDDGDFGTTSICPKGWRLPIGAKTTADKSFGALSVALGGPAGGASANAYTEPTGTVISPKFRSYPNNYVFPGYLNDGAPYRRGTTGYYLSSTSVRQTNVGVLSVSASNVSPGTENIDKYFGLVIRCVVNS